MPRTIDPVAQQTRRQVYVEAAQRLIQERGYERMSIEDVLHATHSSRGAFYHYFASKAELLEAVSNSMVEALVDRLGEALKQPAHSLSDTLNRLFTVAGSWKSGRRELLLALLQCFLSDENVLLREKLRQGEARLVIPMLSATLAAAGRKHQLSSGPDATAQVAMALVQGIGTDSLALLASSREDSSTLGRAKELMAAYAEAFERLLALPPGSLCLADEAVLEEWFT